MGGIWGGLGSGAERVVPLRAVPQHYGVPTFRVLRVFRVLLGLGFLGFFGFKFLLGLGF